MRYPLKGTAWSVGQGILISEQNLLRECNVTNGGCRPSTWSIVSRQLNRNLGGTEEGEGYSTKGDHH